MSTVYMYISERCAANSLLAPPQVRGSTQWHDGTVLLFACLMFVRLSETLGAAGAYRIGLSYRTCLYLCGIQ